MERFNFWGNIVQGLALVVIASVLVWAFVERRRAARDLEGCPPSLIAAVRYHMKVVLLYGSALFVMGLGNVPPFEDTFFDDFSLLVAALMMLGAWLWERRVARSRAV